MKPGAMNSFAQVASPYHTIQVTPTQKVPIMKKNSKKKSSKDNSKAAIPYTTSDNNLELYGAMFKNQRSNSWGEVCEEALQQPVQHFSPLNTVAGMWELWVAFLSHFDFSRKTKNFKPFFAKNEKKTKKNPTYKCC